MQKSSYPPIVMGFWLSGLDFKEVRGRGKVKKEWPSRYGTARNICQISRVYTYNLAVKIVLIDLCFQSVVLIITPITLLVHWQEESFDLILYRQWLLFGCYFVLSGSVSPMHRCNLNTCRHTHTGIRKDGGCLTLSPVVLVIHSYVFYNYILRTSENRAVSLQVPWLNGDWI